MAAVGEKSSKDKVKSLTCVVCLGVFTKPKLLPCSHTFCEKCLENLATGPNSRRFTCPSCRTQIDVPSSGVSAFQNNFYIDPDDLENARYGLFCTLHPSRELELFCQECDLPICLKCKVTDHHSHGTNHLQRTAVPTSREKEAVRKKRCGLQQAILHREAILKAVLESSRKEALASLDKTTDAVSEAMTSSWVKDITRPVLRFSVITDSLLQRMRDCVGSVTKMSVPVSAPEVTVSERFRCSQDPDKDIRNICPLTNGKVWVAYGPTVKCNSNQSGDTVISHKFDENGKIVGEFLSDDSGDLLVRTRRKNGQSMYMKSKSNRIIAYAKRCEAGLTRFFRLDNSLTGEADVKIVTVISEDPFDTQTTDFVTFFSEAHHAFDVDTNEQHFVVLQDLEFPQNKRRVQLYRRSKPDPVATYTAPRRPFLPSDVCFFKLSGQEVLLVADELNDAIHVVEVQEDKLTFSRYLVPGCPLLVQPTALSTDMEGRLWVACRGGRILTCTPLS